MTFVPVPGVFLAMSRYNVYVQQFFCVGIRIAYFRPLIDEDVANISFWEITGEWM